MCQVSIFWHCWFTRRRFLNIKIINHFRPPLGTPDMPNITLEEDHPRNIWANLVKIDKMVSEIHVHVCAILKKTSGRGW
jgi:hypothetical protein